MSNIKFFKKKVYVCGSYLEIVENKTSFFSRQVSSKKNTSSLMSSLVSQKAKEEHAKFNSLVRTKRKIRQLVRTNLKSSALFLTLTTRENITDYVRSANQFRRFMQHLKRNGYYYPYMATREKQKRGAIHYHVILFNVSFIPYEILSYWSEKFKGNVDFSSVKKTRNVLEVVSYLLKYITKDVGEVKFKKRYLVNKLIKYPKILYCSDFLTGNYELIFRKNIVNDFNVEIEFSHYKLKKGNEILEYLEKLDIYF